MPEETVRKTYYATHQEERKAYSNAYYAAHREERKACRKAYYATHREELKVYRAAHREEQKAYRAVHQKKLKAYNKTYNGNLSSSEMIIVAQIRGDNVPRCRYDLTPGPFSLSCAGELQIDHINGGGRNESGYRRQIGVIDGTRDLDDLRILCERHNFEYALQRGNTKGGSAPEEWQ